MNSISVGLVVGPKGTTIKNIQQQTQTYIVTPSRDKEPVFEVTGLPDNVQSARRQIEAHIVLRTGHSAGSNGAGEMSNDISLSGSQDFLSSPLLSSLYKNGLSSLLEHFELKDQEDHFGQATQMTSSTGSSTCSSNSSTSSKSTSMMIRPELIDLWKTMGNENSIDCDEGISDSPINIWSLPNSASLIGSRSSPTASASPTDSLLNTAATQPKTKRDCYYCGEKESNSILVPCGHQIFCYDCSERICDAHEPCPVCNQKPTSSMKILV